MKIFLDDFGIFLGRKWNRFIVKKTGGEVKEIAANDVDSIICCSSGVAFSASALDLVVQNNIRLRLLRWLALCCFDACLYDWFCGSP